MTTDSPMDPFDFAASVDERVSENGQQEGRQYGYQRGFRQGFSRGLDYALENHRQIAHIAAYCEQLTSTNDSDPRRGRLLNGISESCREFRTLVPDTPRYAELLASIRARHQHLTGTTTSSQSTEKANLTF